MFVGIAVAVDTGPGRTITPVALLLLFKIIGYMGDWVARRWIGSDLIHPTVK